MLIECKYYDVAAKENEELLEQNDIYREVYESQTSGGGDFDEKEEK